MLPKDIERGRKAIALAREQGKETSEWEARLADLERQHLLGWASELSEQQLEVEEPVEFVERPLVPVYVRKLSAYAARHLWTINLARQNQVTGGWHPWTAEWWQERESEALGALHALREAMEGTHD